MSSYEAPSLNSPEFDQLAKEWIEELIRRARATKRSSRATRVSPPAPVSVRARGEGPYAFDFFLTNLYDLRVDPLGLMAGLNEVSRDALEGPISSVFDFEDGPGIAVLPMRADESVH
jgi:hypothetical protein